MFDARIFASFQTLISVSLFPKSSAPTLEYYNDIIRYVERIQIFDCQSSDKQCGLVSLEVLDSAVVFTREDHLIALFW